MAFAKSNDPIAQLPPYEYMGSLREKAKQFKKDPLAALMVEEIDAAEKLYDKELRAVIDGTSDAAENVIVDVAALNKSLADDSKTLFQRLKKVAPASNVASLYAAAQGKLNSANVLLAVARKTKDSAALTLARELKEQVARLDDVQARLSEGGHPALPLEVSRTARKCWAHLDSATHLLAVLLLREAASGSNATSVYDPVYANRPKVKSALRIALSDVVPGTAPKRASKKKAAAPKTGSQSAPAAPAGTPPTQNGAAAPQNAKT
jgi:hypothetical protein